MNDELQVGDIVYYVSPERMVILEVVRVKPILDDDMFIKKDMFDKNLVSCDGISYMIKKFNANQPSERL